jgi:hypothetical protein
MRKSVICILHMPQTGSRRHLKAADEVQSQVWSRGIYSGQNAKG